jgi:hypothetical protein
MWDRLNHPQPPTASTWDQNDGVLHVLLNPLRHHASSHSICHASSPEEIVRFLRTMPRPIGESAPNVLMSCDRLSSQIDCCCLLNQYVCVFSFSRLSLSLCDRSIDSTTLDTRRRRSACNVFSRYTTREYFPYSRMKLICVIF